MLSKKVGVCALIDKLDETKCLDVIRLWRDELCCKNLNELLIKLVIDTKHTFTIKSLDNIKKNIKQIIKNDPKLESQSPKADKKNDNSDMKPKIFPLLQLPIDLITNASLFLNENEILKFEKCCRLFYQMVNNVSYLRKCNRYNFKTFEITQNRLLEMIKPEYNFFKYSQAKVLKFNMREGFDNYDESQIVQMLLAIYLPMWEQAQSIENKNGDWLTSLMKSVKVIQLGIFSIVFLPKLPIDILFDPDESQLEGIELDHFLEHDQQDQWTLWMNEFEQKYLNLQNRLQRHGKNILTLEFVHHNNDECVEVIPISSPRYVAAKCIFLDWVRLDVTGNDAMYLNSRICPALKMMTIRFDIVILNHNSLAISRSQVNVNNTNHNQNFGIDTLRLVSFNMGHNSILLNDKNVIESLNLHNSLKNLTVELQKYSFRNFMIKMDEKKWYAALRNILRKEHYYNLENVNILFDNVTQTQLITFFKILKENKHVLQYQFKQLNIGFRFTTAAYPSCHYDVLMWNHNVDDQFLDKKMDSILRVIKDTNDKSSKDMVVVKPSKEAKQNYYTWRMQWVKQSDYHPLTQSYH